jgi:protein-tyrosine phosphatase
MIQNILVVCLGNICRSPMGEGMFRHALPKVQVASAGLGAMTGHGADPMAIALMSEQQIDITSHRAKMITDIMARDNDMIFVMDNGQKEQTLRQYPFARGKVFRLGDPIQQDIPDPYQLGEEAFRASHSLIQQSCDAWVKRIFSIS